MVLSQNCIRIGLLILLLTGISLNAFSQASIVAGSVTTSKTAYTVGLGNNRLIVVAVSQKRTPLGTISGITWGGQALTLARGQTGGGSLRGEIWYLNESGISSARSGCSYNFVVNWTAGPTDEAFTAFTLKDVDQTTPLAVSNSGTANNVASQSSGLIAAGLNDIVIYASISDQNRTHTAATGYLELSDQVIGGNTSQATAYKQISVAGNENPSATWVGGNSRLITIGAVFKGIMATSTQTFYSRATGAWDANTSWSFSADGSSGAVPVGVWPTRTDNVVIRSGHNITVNATDDNKICGQSPDGLALGNVGPFISSNVSMFYQTGDITIAGTLTVTGIEMMVSGYTHVLAGGAFNLSSYLVNVGYLEADAASTLSTLDDFVITGSSTTIINTNATSADDIIIDHTNATLCGTGTATLQNGGGSTISYANSATVNQICTSFTINCTGGGCTGFPVVGTNPTIIGNSGPGGVGNSSNNRLWLMANQSVFTDAGTTSASNNQLIQQWNDVSGNGRNGIELTNKPTFMTNIVNSQPVVRFDNADRLLATGLTTGNSASVYVVAQYSSLPSTNPGLVQGSPSGLGFDTNGNNKSIGMWVSNANNAWGRAVQSDNTIVNLPTSSALSASTFYSIANVMNAGTTALNQYIDNTLAGSIAYNGTLKSWTDFGIGRQGGETWNGDIAEVIVYNAAVNASQRIILSNYLSAKYTTSLTVGNNVYTMDDVGNGNFDFEVAGIGQASDGSSHKDAKGSGVVRMWNPNGLGNGEFLLWGHDNATLNSSTKAVGTAVDGTIIQERLSRIWRVSEVGDVGNVSISIDYSALGGTPLGSNLCLLIDRDGDGFADNDITPIAGSVLNKIAIFSNVNLQNGDRFTLGNTNAALPLPIELISFTATAHQAEVKLAWSTASELNNDFFTIQRSQDAEAWNDVITIKGAGTRSFRTDYETTDGLPFNGVSYYRLKQTDFDKQYSYSQVKRVELNNEFQLKVYPNPSNGTFTVSTGFEIGLDNIRLTNMVGQTIPIQLQTDKTSATLTSKSIAPGIYILQVSKGFWRQSVRIVIE